MNLARFISAPTIFNGIDKTNCEVDRDKYNADIATRFYDICLFEVYAHALIPKLENWQEVISEYINEYNGSWEYYARAKRLEIIDKHGGSDTDYNNDGTIKADVTIQDLESYCVLRDLVNDDWRDIVLQTTPSDLQNIYAAIRVCGGFSITDMFQAMGADNLKSYRMEDGEVVVNSEMDEALNKVSSQSNSDGISAILYCLVMIVNKLVEEIKEKDWKKDNQFFLRGLNDRIQNVIDLNITNMLHNYASEKKN